MLDIELFDHKCLKQIASVERFVSQHWMLIGVVNLNPNLTISITVYTGVVKYIDDLSEDQITR